MKYKAEQKIRTEIFYQTTIKEEQLFRDVALAIVKDLPIEKVKQLFNLKVTYGTTEELDKAYKEADHYKVQTVSNLIKEGATLFTGEIDIE